LTFLFFWLSMLQQTLVQFFEWILKKEWIHNEHLKRWNYIFHAYKINKSGLKKCHSNVKNKIKIKISHHQIKSLKIRCIETFTIQEVMILKIKYHHYSSFFFISHWNLQSFALIFLVSHMLSDIYKATYQYYQRKA